MSNLSRHQVLGVAVAAILAAGLGAAACGGSGFSSSPTSPTPPGASGGNVVTINIGPNGVDAKSISIDVGGQVRFVNNDSVFHEIRSNPNPTHDDCPPINNVGTIAPGASGITGVFTVVRACGYHDHLKHDDARFQGTILVGNAQPAPGPGY